MTKHDIQWFRDRKNKEVIRTYKNKKEETKVVICGEKTEDYCKYFYELQNDGFVFRDTGANIAASQYDFELPEGDGKRVTRPRVHVSDETCVSCQ